MLVAIVGMPGAGKSEVSGHLKDKLKFGYLRFGDVVEDGVKEQGKEVNEKNEREYREKIREELGMKAVAVKLDPKIKEAIKSDKNIVLDGLYSWEEYEHLKRKYPNLVLINVSATPATRYKRLSVRPHRPLNSKEARSRDVAELVGLNKGGPIALADFLIVNEGSIEDLHKETDRVVGDIESNRYWISEE